MQKADVHVVVAGGIILVVGVLTAVENSQPVSKVLEGSVVLILLLALLVDLDPEHLGKIAYALASLAVLSTLLVELPPLLKKLTGA